MNEREIFTEAIGLPDRAERAAYLDRACGSSGPGRERIEQLLALHEGPGLLLDLRPDAMLQELSAFPEPLSAGAPRPALEAGALVGPYRLLEKIGEGGMGEVWVARQSEPVKRQVALKVLKPGLDSRMLLARFEQERQALALMDHPNIARMLDAGLAPTGQPYFVMELVDGLPLTRYCDEARLTPRQRLELMVPVCQAVQHAHSKGVIHRDLKPANILVTLVDGRPVPKVIDFGVAKAVGERLTEQTLSTQLGAVVGTLDYMAPEQAGFTGVDVDTRADVYALGVVLYELLTGLRPIDPRRVRDGGIPELLRILREEEPASPSTRLSASEALPTLAERRQTGPGQLMGLLKGELDWVVMKCLEKQRERRYETADALACDIRRFLANEPVEARPPSLAYWLVKFLTRNRGPAIAACLLLLALIAGVVGTSIGFFQAAAALRAELSAREAEREARQAEQEANEQTRKRLAQIEKANALLLTIFRDINPRDTSLGAVPLRATLARRVEKALGLLDEMDGDPLDMALLRDQLGQTLIGLGEPRKPIPLLEKARATLEARLGPDHLHALRCTRHLVMAHHEAGNRGLAISLGEEALKRMKAALGPNHAETLNMFDTLALAYEAAGKEQLALPLYEEALARKKAVLGPDHPSTLSSMHNVAGLYRLAGKTEQAISLFEETIKGGKAKLGPNHPQLLQTMNNLALAYLQAGKPQRGVPLLEEAVRLSLSRLGPDHPHTARFRGNLAWFYWSTKQYDKAVPIYEDGLKRLEAKLGRDHPQALNAAGNLGVNYQETGRITEAIPPLERAFAASRKYPELRGFAYSLFVCYLRTGKWGKAAAVAWERPAAVREFAAKTFSAMSGPVVEKISQALKRFGLFGPAKGRP